MMNIINEAISMVLGVLFIFLYVILLGYYISCMIYNSITNKVNNNNKRNYDCDKEYEWQDKKLKTN